MEHTDHGEVFTQANAWHDPNIMSLKIHLKTSPNRKTVHGSLQATSERKTTVTHDLNVGGVLFLLDQLS